jgi:hypothetical protein
MAPLASLRSHSPHRVIKRWPLSQQTDQRVPHVSLVFRETWVTRTLLGELFEQRMSR